MIALQFSQRLDNIFGVGKWRCWYSDRNILAVNMTPDRLKILFDLDRDDEEVYHIYPTIVGYCIVRANDAHYESRTNTSISLCLWLWNKVSPENKRYKPTLREN